MFQSRNRDAFDFKSTAGSSIHSKSSGLMFQSRNRDAFDFKSRLPLTRHRFGLPFPSFQSRNRDAFDFKYHDVSVNLNTGELFQSRNRDAFDFKRDEGIETDTLLDSFNLVIEMLLISSETLILHWIHSQKFQSRNRDAFDFKRMYLPLRDSARMFQSRNRDAFDFKRRKGAYQ